MPSTRTCWPTSRRPSHPIAGDQFLYSQISRACLQAADPDDRRARRRGDDVVPGQPGHRARLGLPLRRGAHRGRRRLDHAPRCQRPFQPGHRGVPVQLLGPQSLPGALRHARCSSTRATRPTPDDDFYSCDPVGTSGEWHATSGTSDGWETWSVALADAGGAPRQVEVSITYASDGFVQGRGVVIDEITVSTGQGSTGFEADGNTLDGWTTPPAPEGSQPNQNTWDRDQQRGRRARAWASAPQLSFDRPAGDPRLGVRTSSAPIPFSAVGRHRRTTGPSGSPSRTRLGRTTRRSSSARARATTTSSSTRLAHQWFGDYLAVDTWQNTWLNEGFATYAEWLWGGARRRSSPPQDVWNFFASIPADDEFWDFAIGDPGARRVVCRAGLRPRRARPSTPSGARSATHKFFQILQQWVITQGGGTVSTREFIDLAESIYKKDLDPLFAVWLSAGKPASIVDNNPGRTERLGWALGHLTVRREAAG